jgi:hypothetical protein
VAAIVASSRSLAHAAQRLGYNKGTISRWVNAGKCPAPGTVVAAPELPAIPEDDGDPLHGFTVEEVLDDRPRPWPDAGDRRRWVVGRRYVHRLADENGFDPRPVLTMSQDEYQAWRERRLAWLRSQLERN